MQRITVYDKTRKCYIVPPESVDMQGQIIQRLGQLEDREYEAMWKDASCGACGRYADDDFYFCPGCGQRLSYVADS